MKTDRPQLRLCNALLLVAILAISACSNTGPAPVVRQFTYPPDFKYVSGQEFRSRMDQLAYQLQLLDQALAQSDVGQANQQRQVVETLGNIERVASSLQAGEAGSTHPFLKDFMSEFRSEVGQARSAASMNPPAYYLAGRVAGGCVNCHKVNR